jgi:hypothetical protein
MTPTPSAHLQTSGEGFSARIDTLHVEYTANKPTYRVDVRIENQTQHKVHLAPEKIELALLGASKVRHQSVQTSTNPLEGANLGSPVEGAIVGAQAGSSLGRVTGSSGLGGGIVGAGLGIAGAMLIMIPLAIVVVIDAAIIEGEKNLDKGEGGTYRVVLPNESIDNGKPYALLLDGALGLSRGTLPPLMLVRPGEVHLGYQAPTAATWIFAGRLGGGVIRRAPVTAGLGGFEIFIGRQMGKFAFGGFGTLGAGAWGGEMRMRFEPAKVVSIVPFFGYGYYPIVGYLGFNAGHGPRWGIELQFSTGDQERFGYARNVTKVGIYALGGPVYLNAIDGVAFAGQVGLSFGIF